MKHYIIGFGTKISVQQVPAARWGVSEAWGFHLVRGISSSWYQAAEDGSWSSSYQWIVGVRGQDTANSWLYKHTPRHHLPHLCSLSCWLFFSPYEWMKWVSYQGGDAGAVPWFCSLCSVGVTGRLLSRADLPRLFAVPMAGKPGSNFYPEHPNLG